MKIKLIPISILIVLLSILGFLTYKLSQQPNVNAKNQQLFASGLGSGNRNGQGDGNGFGKAGNNGPAISRNNCFAEDCLAIDNLNYPAGDLSNDAKSALLTALDDEYKAQATYETIIAKLGNVRPFIMIIRAEEQHISSLKALFDKYGIDIPENPYTNKVTSPDTMVEACNAGVQAEIANASLYKNKLLPMVKDYEDITLVFNNLMNASQQKHLTAFQKCAQ
jgi:hypothetical protein